MTDRFDLHGPLHDCPLTPHELHVLKVFIEFGTEPAAAEALSLSHHTPSTGIWTTSEKS